MLKSWSDDVVLCTDGPCGLTAVERETLTAASIEVHEQRIVRLEGTDDGRLEWVVLEGRSPLPRSAIFLNTGQTQRSPLLERLQCGFTDKGGVQTGEKEETCVPGLWVAGDASRDVQMAIVAAAEGATAAVAIDHELLLRDGRI
jgi:thioredoxin reductase